MENVVTARMKSNSENKGRVIIYKTDGEQEAIDIRLENETVWLIRG